MLKTVLLAGAAALFATTASAQPEGLVGSPTTPWAGPYIGIHGGWGTDRDSAVITNGLFPNTAANVANEARPPNLQQDRDGYVAGGQIGYNIQRGMFVGGVEADFSATDMASKYAYASPRTFGAAPAGTRSNITVRNNYLGSVRGRLGIANDNLLIYGTGGFGYGDTRANATFRNGVNANQIDFAGSRSDTNMGWVAGAGVEYAIPVTYNPLGRFGSSWATIRAEYLHYDLGERNLFVNPVNGSGSYVSRYSNDADVFRAGLNFKF